MSWLKPRPTKNLKDRCAALPETGDCVLHPRWFSHSSTSCASPTSLISFVSLAPPPTPPPSRRRSNLERRPHFAHEDCYCFRGSKKSNARHERLSHNRKVQRHVQLFRS